MPRQVLVLTDGEMSNTGEVIELARRHAARPRRTVRAQFRLIDLQRADGSWDLTEEFADAVSMTLRDLEKALRGEWELLARKATAWRSASRTEPAAGLGWNARLDVARRLL